MSDTYDSARAYLQSTLIAYNRIFFPGQSVDEKTPPYIGIETIRVTKDKAFNALIYHSFKQRIWRNISLPTFYQHCRKMKDNILTKGGSIYSFSTAAVVLAEVARRRAARAAEAAAGFFAIGTAPKKKEKGQ